MKHDARSRKREFLARWSLIAIAALAACGDEFPCDPDQTSSNGTCFAPDAPASTADADLRFAHFGDVCADDTACALPTAFCVKQPGSEAGYCTGIGCLEDPAVCPVDWSCFDLSIYGPGLPSICRAP